MEDRETNSGQPPTRPITDPVPTDMKFGSMDAVRITPEGDETVFDAVRRTGEVKGSFVWGKRRIDSTEYDCLYCLPPQDNALIVGLPVTRDRALQDKRGEDGTFWWWNGDYDRPTLAPSIGVPARPPYRWHGHLTAGRWEACE